MALVLTRKENESIQIGDEGIGRINTPSSSQSTIKSRLLAIAKLLSIH